MLSLHLPAATVTIIVLPLRTVTGESVMLAAPEVSFVVPRLTGVQKAIATVCVVENFAVQAPLVTCARKSVWVARLPVSRVALVSKLMLVNAAAPTLDCHWIEPVEPLSVMVVPLLMQTGVTAAVAVPPRLVGLTVTVATVERAEAQ